MLKEEEIEKGSDGKQQQAGAKKFCVMRGSWTARALTEARSWKTGIGKRSPVPKSEALG